MKLNLDAEKIKSDMKELWKNTFHDSSRYINIVFDTYFKPENAFTVYDGEKLIASLLGVEYYFQAPDDSGQTVIFKAMYLCGLATRPDYRKRGIMGELMKTAENSAKERGYNMTFLIPADSHLREYYRKKGYTTASFKRCQMMKKAKSDGSTEMYKYTFQEFFQRGNLKFINDLAGWCSEKELLDRSCATILHSKKDMMAIMSENENSFFITDCSFDPEYPILAKVRAVVFPTEYSDKNKQWGIVGIYLDDNTESISSNAIDVQIPENIKAIIQSIHPESEIEIKLPYTGKELPKEGGDEPYAMVKPIKDIKKLSVFENKLFKISLMLD